MTSTGIVFLLMIIVRQSGTTFHLKALLHPKLKSVCTAEESRVIHGNIGRRTSLILNDNSVRFQGVCAEQTSLSSV
jgi:hypothetical protein